MERWIVLPGALVALLLALAIGYAATGYYAAKDASEALALRAETLIEAGRGPDGLGDNRIEQLLKIQDPDFYTHNGIDLATPGTGLTTLTQALAKQIGFEDFKPGVHKLKLIGYAIGLERELSKDQIFALYLDTVEMGRGPDGWMTGFFDASLAIYRRPAARLGHNDFLRLVAVMIAPAQYDLIIPDASLVDRVERLRRRLSGQCSPGDLFDIWLEGCARKIRFN